ncbi:MAG: 2-polyprenyl-3-methyl-6-methoxy-1,4-benzoquinone monooxygenase [Gammaproteobacteria bacterium]|nr:2-polyprenyl-3-methyl-6-methoxy-1,4-benzoquinone monooxygenase [Gammaproteobacteria bacterium]MDH3505624.1 2-polyprenyl-3-methyl-6-methoxy-1,4-benzoquinone monooxygenase [Gammaproteobacteria bacterium]
MTRGSTWSDRLIGAADEALRAVTGPAGATRPSPAGSMADSNLDPQQRATSIELMRVNHAGEIAAQALYSGQAVLARATATREHLLQAGREEQDHLAWCRERLEELGARPSLLTPVWYAGAFTIGLIAGAAGDRISLGFIAETEKQVEAHIHDHLDRLPPADEKSAAILEQMASDEAHHGTTARLAGGVDLPTPARSLMTVGGEILRRVAAKV